MKARPEHRCMIPLGDRPRVRHCGAGTFYKSVKTYCLDLWTMHLFHYEATVVVDDIPVQVHPGTIAVWPPGVVKTYHFPGTSPHHFAHFYFEQEQGLVPFYNVVDTEEAFPRIEAECQEFVRSGSTDRLRVEVRLWDILLQLQAAQTPQTPGPHPAVQTATRRIELQLANDIDIPGLCAGVGISHNHLIRLFRKHYGVTIRDYIRQRRLARAKHLLECSDQPIKEIAHDVGIPNLQYFNKCIRRIYGCSPRELRKTR